MNTLVDFRFSKGILYKAVEGIITKDLIFQSWNKVFDTIDTSHEIRGVIIDCSKGHFDIPVSMFTEVITFYKNLFDMHCNSRVAVITNNPGDAVLSILLESAVTYSNTKTFSTIEAAELWLIK
ncbi:hypothetical protein ACE1ET_07885 [Saccharicrinis sp. FJH62]|uniref:hypothetical protein n=1 Tax=Saccharicrinis sp. FJH62 TaxID=3344657 RepID=UPI0035D43CDC